MDLQPLYELKERLEHAAIAGTALLAEDFRLRRALDALAPLAGASAVFARISANVAALLEAPAEQRGTLLLDALALVDAVVYTQGTTGAPGELAPFEAQSGRPAEIPRSALEPLLTALQGTGRYADLKEVWDTHPGYYADPRVQPVLIGALAGGCSDLLQRIARKQLEDGTCSPALLRDGFDPDGKKDMAFRVHLLAEMPGADVREWLLGVLPEAKKEVRDAVILALGRDAENLPLLLELEHTERGARHDAVLRALAMIGTEAARPPLEKAIAKNEKAVELLTDARSELAAELAADALAREADRLLADANKEKDPFTQLHRCRPAIRGKYSAHAAAMWRQIAEKMPQLAHIHRKLAAYGEETTAAQIIADAFLDGMERDPGEELRVLARELGRDYPQHFLASALLADAPRLSAAELYEKYAPYIVRQGFLKKETAAEKAHREQVTKGLSCILWDKAEGYYVAVFTVHPITRAVTPDLRIPAGHRVTGVDPRWFTLLTDPKVERDERTLSAAQLVPGYPYSGGVPLDHVLTTLMDRTNPEECRVVGAYLYGRAVDTGFAMRYLPALMWCGWTDWAEYYSKCAKKMPRVLYYDAENVLNHLPITNAQKAAEWRRLDRMGGKNWPAEYVRKRIADLEADPDTVQTK